MVVLDQRIDNPLENHAHDIVNIDIVGTQADRLPVTGTGIVQHPTHCDRASLCCTNPLVRYDRAPEFTLMIMHMVLLKIRKDVPAADVRKAFDALAALQKVVPGLLSFHGGPYSSPENFEKGYTHGFSMVFKDAASRDIYLPHPEHEKCKAMIFPLLQGGLDGAVAFDYEF